MPVETQLAEAKALIQQKRYHEARYILSNIDDHPIAAQWLAKLDKVAPVTTELPEDDEWSRLVKANATKRKNRPAPKPKATKPQSRGGGLDMKLTAIVVVVLLIVGGGVAFVFLNPDLSPIPPADETGCGAQDWYNPYNGLLADIIYSDPWALVDAEVMEEQLGVTVIPQAAARRRTHLSRRLASIQATPAPSCIAGAGTALQDALQAQLTMIDRLENDNANGAFYNIGVSVENVKAAYNDMRSVGVRFRGNDARAMQQLTDHTCPALDWAFRVMYTEIQFFVLVLNTDDLIKSSNIDAAITNFSADFAQQAFRLEYNIATPPCMEKARDHMLMAIESYKGAIDSVRGDPRNALTRAIPYHSNRLMDAITAFYDELSAAGVNPGQFGGSGAYHFGF